MTFLLAFWKPIAAIVAMLALAAAVIVVKHGYDRKHEAIGAARVQALWDLDSARRVKLTTDMVNLWNDKRQEAEHVAAERDMERASRAVQSLASARRLPVAVAAVRVDHAAVRVLDDAIDASNTAHPAQPAGEPKQEAPAVAESADTTVGLLTQWGVQCIAAYDEARGMVEGWQLFYSSLRAAQ